jgi:hypothetical protein
MTALINLICSYIFGVLLSHGVLRLGIQGHTRADIAATPILIIELCLTISAILASVAVAHY